MSTDVGRIAFMGMDDMGAYVCDDDLAVPHLARLGWEVETVPWRSADPRWERFAGVVIRTPWDYQDDVAAFLGVLERIASAGVPLANPLPLVRANVRKTYLLDLAARGCPVPRTEVVPALDARALASFAREAGPAGVVAKPVVGASGWEAFHVRPGEPATADAALRALGGREVLLQPFLSEVLTAGERSLVYMGGAFSHALDKRPVPGEFRVQEEHGGIITPAEPDQASLEVADAIMRALDPVPLYGRVDLARRGPRPMELELVEPALYLRTDAGAPARFAAAVDAWVRAAASAPPLSPTRPLLSSRP